MKIVVNGVSLEGDEAQIANLLKTMGVASSFRGDARNYYSESKGKLLPIAEMNTTHIRNAIMKWYREWLDDLFRTDEPKEFVNKIVGGIDNITWAALLREYQKREKE